MEELVQTGEREPGLGLGSGGPDHFVARLPGRLRDMVEQGALAHPRFTPEDEGLPLGGCHERGQPLPLTVPADHRHKRLHGASLPFTTEPATCVDL